MPYGRLMMTNRDRSEGGLGISISKMRYFEHKSGPLDALGNWAEMSKKQFRDRLLSIVAEFPPVPEDRNQEQQHVSVFVHGYNNSWDEAAKRYDQIQSDLFEKRELGQSILFTWPSDGMPADYLPDREDARDSAAAFAQELVDLHDYLISMQRLAARSTERAQVCRAKVSIIAHSMGNFVVQKALAIAAKKLNSPQLVTLITQLAMVAADVDNDIFQRDKPPDSDGSLMSNVCYRICALFTGLDQVLGASAGLKHFGTRRLGRSGLSDRNDVWDNVTDFDVSDLIQRENVHSAVFESKPSMDLVEKILRGVDRNHLLAPG